jgi:hypothetical protein
MIMRVGTRAIRSRGSGGESVGHGDSDRMKRAMATLLANCRNAGLTVTTMIEAALIGVQMAA